MARFSQIDGKAVISNTLAGVLIAIMNITVAISVAALMFAGTQPEFLVSGIVVLLIGTLVVGLAGTLFSGFGAVICAPRSGLAPVFAAILGGIFAQLGDSAPGQALPTMLAAIMVTSVVTGIFLILLGQLKLGNLVRYIPYPVMGGFFAGIGFIFVKGGLTVAMGQAPDLQMINDLHLIHLAVPAVLFAVTLYLVQTNLDHWSTFPLVLIGALAIFYAAFFIQDQNIGAMAAAGWLPQIDSTPGVLFPVVGLADLANINWVTIAFQAGGILVVALLCAIILLLDTSGIEIITRRDLVPDKELRVMGMANVASGMLGGYPGVHVASDTAFTWKLGGDRRLMGFVYAAVVIGTILAGTDFIAAVPTFILGGLLVYVGVDFLMDWVWKTRKELPLADYCIILVILAAIAVVDILEGVAFGFAVAIVLFVVNYSRLSVIKSEANGREHASNVDRDLATRELLNREGDRILILMLQGFIFFGTSDRLMSDIRRRIEDASRTKLEFLVLDFHHVSQLDTSASKAFSKLAQLSESYGFHIVITGADEADVHRLEGIHFMTEMGATWQHIHFEQLDDGVAWCEERILRELDVAFVGPDENLLHLLVLITRDEQIAREISPWFTTERRPAGDYLFRQGEKGDSLYLVGSGSVAVVMEGNGQQRVLRRYRAGAMLGEMALYTGEPRSAAVIIEEDAVLYRLTADQLHGLEAAHSTAAGVLHAYVVRVLSERLGRANRELARYL